MEERLQLVLSCHPLSALEVSKSIESREVFHQQNQVNQPSFSTQPSMTWKERKMKELALRFS